MKTAVARGWSEASDCCARDDTPSHSYELEAIWLNLPEEQADLKD